MLKPRRRLRLSATYPYLESLPRTCSFKSSMEQDKHCAKADNPSYFMITDMPMPWGQITSLPFATVRP